MILKFKIGIAVAVVSIAVIAFGVVTSRHGRAKAVAAEARDVASIQIAQIVNDWWSKHENVPLTWTADFALPKTLAPMTPRKLGIHPDLVATVNKTLTNTPAPQPDAVVPPPGMMPPPFDSSNIVWQVDQSKIQKAFYSIRKLTRPARDAKVKFIGGNVVVIPERIGARFDLNGAISSIKQALQTDQTIVTLSVLTDKPRITQDQVSDITGVVSSYTTRFSGWKGNRSHNIQTAAAAINGTVLFPGDTFSYNKVVGPRESSTGFLTAPVLVKGKKVPGLGGGICQVSSTIYNAVLFADLKIIQRSRHAIPVAYIPAGRDATVVYGLLDLKFQNNTSAPIAISTSTQQGSITARVLGTPTPDKKIKILVTGLTRLPMPIKRVPDGTLFTGSTLVVDPGHSGRRCSTWRYVYEDSALVRKEHLSSDYYRPLTRIIAYGTKSRAPKTPSSLTPVTQPISPPTVPILPPN